MSKEIIIEKLNSIRNEMTHLWGSVFILAGGSIALLLDDFSFKKLLLGLLGMILAILLFNTYFIRRIELQKMIKKMEEE